VLENSGSPGLSLIVWILGGFIAMLGALCYAEVGTLIPKSGGEHAVLYHGLSFGRIPAFMFAFTSATVLKPASLAILAMPRGVKILIRYELNSQLLLYSPR